MLVVGGFICYKDSTRQGGLQKKSRRDLIFVTKEQNSNKESHRDSMFFDIVLKKNKVEILEIFLDKKNKDLTEDTIHPCFKKHFNSYH